MDKLLVCELKRVMHDPIIWIVAGSLAVFGALYADPNLLSESAAFLPDIPADARGIFMVEAADAGFAFLLIGSAASSLTLGRRFSERTINLEIASGHSRAEVFGVQCVTCLLLPVALTAIALVAGFARYSIEVVAPDQAALLYFVRAMVLLVPPLVALSSPASLFVSLFRDTARSTAATTVFLFLALWTMALIAPPDSTMAGMSYANDPSIAQLMHPAFLVRWVLNPDLGAWQSASAAAVCVCWAFAFVASSWLVLRRCDLR